MGYNTEFDGKFVLSKPLDEETYYALEELVDSRHDEEGMPSIWCQWKVGADWQSIMWDENEKFYGYIGWIRYINQKFLLPKGIKLNGRVTFQGEDPKDGGVIVAKDGKVKVSWNYDDPKLSNYDPKSKCWCHIPAGQGVCWINEEQSVFCDFFDSNWTCSEEQDSMEKKMIGITIGNRRAMALLIDVSAKPGSDRPVSGLFDSQGYQHARLMSFDAVMPLIDGECGARARLTQLYKATLRESSRMRWKDVCAARMPMPVRIHREASTIG